MPTKLKITVVIDHDVIVRHFVQNGIVAALAGLHDVTVVLPPPGNKRLTMDEASFDVGPVQSVVRVEQDPERAFLWRRLFQVSKMRWRPGQHARTLRRHLEWTVGWKAAVLFRWLSFPGVFQLYRKHVLRRIFERPDHIGQFMAHERPDVILHPTVMEGPYLNDLVSFSEKSAIPLALIMNSWDNPSTKRQMIGQPDLLLVWGEQSREHAISLAGLPPSNVEIFGAAQFEIFRKAAGLNAAQFRQRCGIASDIPIVLYAGSSRGTDEFAHLVELDKSISEARLPPASIVYRPHPWGAGGRDGHRILQHEWTNLCIDPTMRDYLEAVSNGENPHIYPAYQDTHDLLSVVSAVITPLSTIGIEAALHGKPVLVFLPTDETSSKRFRIARPLIHFEELLNDKNYIVAEGLRGLVTAVGELIEKSQEHGIADRMQLSAEHYVKTFDKPYVDRLDERLRQLAGRSRNEEIELTPAYAR